jgi:hypothetical protein
MFDIKKAKGYIILRVWLGEKILKCGVVIEIDLTGAFSVGDLEEYAILFTLYFVL